MQRREAAKEPSSLSCMFLNPDQGSPDSHTPQPTWLLRWKEPAGTLGPPHPITTRSHHHCWLFCSFRSPPPSVSHLRTLAGLCPKTVFTASQNVDCTEAGCFPTFPITTLKHPAWQERKEAVKFCSQEDEGLLGVLLFVFPSMRSLPSSIRHKTTRRPVAGAGLPKPVSANSRMDARRTGQWPLQATESCSVLYCLQCDAAS